MYFNLFYIKRIIFENTRFYLYLEQYYVAKFSNYCWHIKHFKHTNTKSGKIYLYTELAIILLNGYIVYNIMTFNTLQTIIHDRYKI